MKTYVNQLLIIAALIIVGCSDPCKDIVCGSGTCDDGTCICPDGYEGNSCETLENEKYFGLYNITEGDCGAGATLTLVSVNIAAKSDGGPFDVTLTLTGSGSDSFDGTINNGKLDGSGDLLGFSTTISGDFTDANSFTGVVAVGGLVSCDITMVK